MSVLTKTLSLIFFLVFFQNFSQEINWISMNEAMKAQKTNPKNLILDVYTNWCGPCKLMDKNTFQKNLSLSTSINIIML
jgi:thiol:disulfide interchange protein